MAQGKGSTKKGWRGFFWKGGSVKHWSQSEAIELCQRIEAICPKFGRHVALTGGLLYRDGERKDCDLLFYRIRQWDSINKDELFPALEAIGILGVTGFGWCHKAQTSDGRKLDLFFPEEDSCVGTDAEYPLEGPIGGGTEQLSGTDRNMPGKPTETENNLAATASV